MNTIAKLLASLFAFFSVLELLSAIWILANAGGVMFFTSSATGAASSLCTYLQTKSSELEKKP